MKTYETHITLPDDSYLPEKFDITTKNFDELDTAKEYLVRQKNTLKDWMINDTSCNIPVTFEDDSDNHKDDFDVVYDISFICIPGNIKCEFIIKQKEI